jgi:thiamine pyrophosphate-dependent acetolactate synthase large subunit-like protein
LLNVWPLTYERRGSNSSLACRAVKTSSCSTRSGELGLLGRLKLPVLVVVFHDPALELIRAQQLGANKRVYGTAFSTPDFVRVAEAYQIDG